MSNQKKKEEETTINPNMLKNKVTSILTLIVVFKIFFANALLIENDYI